MGRRTPNPADSAFGPARTRDGSRGNSDGFGSGRGRRSFPAARRKRPVMFKGAAPMRHDETASSGTRPSQPRGNGTRRDLLRAGGVFASLGMLAAIARPLGAEPPAPSKKPVARSGPLDVDAMSRLIEDTPR